MNHKEMIKQLEDLKVDRKSFFYPEPCEEDEYHRKDFLALEKAISILKELEENQKKVFIDEIKKFGINEVWTLLKYDGVYYCGCLTEENKN